MTDNANDDPRKATKASADHGSVQNGSGQNVGGGGAAVAHTAALQTVVLPWGPRRTAIAISDGGVLAAMAANNRPGEFVLKRLFADFTIMAERKIDQVLGEPLERPLQKTLQRGEDVQFDQLLSTMSCVAEHCLPSLLRILLAWYERQLPTMASGTAVSTAAVSAGAANMKLKVKLGAKGDRDYLCERRDLAVEFLFCLILVEILQQLPFHPGYDDVVNAIINMSFVHFKHNERTAPTDPNTQNINTLADLYGEVIGVVASSRFVAVKKKFMSELRELRSKEAAVVLASGVSSQSANIVTLIMGMKFFRVKMLPIEEFESCVQFLHDLASYFLDVRDKNIKHALAGLFVEILLPMAAIVRTEVNVPVLRTLVEHLYPHAVEMASKKKHCLALFPMATSLLCVSQKVYFIEKWPLFLTMCLTQLKGKDPKMSRVALESLYRLVWVYVVRLKCESNAVTTLRLTTIVTALFKQQQQRLLPRDSPLSIYVKIVQFIAQERLDFAVKEVVYDLLNVNKPARGLLPERMSVGLRAFLVIADSLQQKEGEPPMPQTIAVLPSGSTLRMKKTFLNKMLTDEAAKSIGMSPYYYQVRKALTVMLRLLDTAVGRPLAVTKGDNAGKELDDMVTAERKPKIDLLRTCVAAIPRLMPIDMTHTELVELLLRLTVHVDEELRGLAYQSLQNIMADFSEVRECVVHCCVEFVQKEISDISSPALLDNALRMLQSLLSRWMASLQQQQQQRRGQAQPLQQNGGGGASGGTAGGRPNSVKAIVGPGQSCDISSLLAAGQRQSLREAESLALVSLCACRPVTRRAAVGLMKEAGDLVTELFPSETALIACIDRQLPQIVEQILPHLSPSEKSHLMQVNYQAVDLQWLAERTSPAWVAGCFLEEPVSRVATGGSNHVLYPQSGAPFDAWLAVLRGVLNHDAATSSYPYILKYSWPIVYAKMSALYQLVDPSNPINDHRSSGLLRSGVKKVTTERDMHLNLWQNYAVFACCVVPRSTLSSSASLGASGGGLLSATLQSASSSSEISSLNDSLSVGDSRTLQVQALQMANSAGSCPHTGKDLFRLLVPLTRCESSELRNAVVIALGSVNPEAFYELAEELAPHLKDAIDRRQENARRKRRRDVLRLQLARIFEIAADRGIFAHRLSNVIDPLKCSLKQTFVEFIDGARNVLESEAERDLPILEEVREHFSWFITYLIRHTPVHVREKLLHPELRYNLFSLFARWSGPLGHIHGGGERASGHTIQPKAANSALEVAAAHAMSAVLCCGPVFDRMALASEAQDTGGGYAYSLLNLLLSSSTVDQRVSRLGQDTLALLLSLNASSAGRQLLAWALDCCYTGAPSVADGCFIALASVLTEDRNYPCEPVEALCVALLYTGCPRVSSRLIAAQLLPLLCHRFLSDDAAQESSLADSGAPPSPRQNGDEMSCGSSSCTDLDDVMLTAYGLTQHRIAEKIAGLHPELTMPLFSEFTKRFETALPAVRQILLNCLTPWLLNVELVNTAASGGSAAGSAPGLFAPASVAVSGSCAASLSKCSLTGGGSEDSASFRQLPLKGEGWGSPRATEMVLNNLFYLTVKFGDEHAREIERLWATLAGTWLINARIILRYVLLITATAPASLLEFGKRIVIYVARCTPQPVIDDLMTELQCVELVPFTIERLVSAPFFRVILPKTKLLPALAGPASLEAVASAATSADDVSRDRRDARAGCCHGGGSRLVVPDEAELTLTAESGIVIARRLIHTKPSMLSGYDITTNGGSYSAYDSEKTPRPNTGEQQPASCHPSSMNLAASVTDVRAPADCRQPYPLPMPPDGSAAYFAPLGSFLLPAEVLLPIVGMQRCYLALVFVADLIIAGLDVDWSVHIPVLLHVTFLGFDHGRPLVHEHCKRTLLNLMLVATTGSSCGLRHAAAARLLVASLDTLTSSAVSAPAASMLLPTEVAAPTWQIPSSSLAGHRSSALTWSSSGLGKSTLSIDSTVTLTPESSDGGGGPASGWPSADTAYAGSSQHGYHDVLQQTVLAVLAVLEARKDKVLWCYEDMTPRAGQTMLKSVEQMATLLQAVTAFFRETHARALVDVRWAQTAHQMAVSCSSRHYAGRSLQIFRLLKVPITAQMMSDILSRLVEVVGEASDELHGFVMEILQTVESIVESLDIDGTLYGSEAAKDQFMSTPNLKVHEYISVRRSAVVDQQHSGPKHKRSTSMSLARPGVPPAPAATGLALERRRAATGADSRLKSVSEVEPLALGDVSRPSSAGMPSSSSPRNRSASHAASSGAGASVADTAASSSADCAAETYSSDEKLSVLTQAFWLGASLLESDYEYEFSLAVSLLSAVLRHLKPDRAECRDRLIRLQQQIKWPQFPGVQALLLKGLTSSATAESTWGLLAHMTSCVRAPAICPSDSLGFPVNVMSLLPYLVQNYESPSKLCKEAADSIAEMCSELSPKLDNLATVMRLYSRGAFGKDALQWTKCVVKYVNDVYDEAGCMQEALAVLLEVLERGPASCHASVLLILHCLLHYVDIDGPALKDVAVDVMATVSKFVEGQHWKMAQKILKLAIKSSSSFMLPSTPTGSSVGQLRVAGAAAAGAGSIADLKTAVAPRVHTSFAEAEITVKKELPGRTIEFSFDLSQTRLVGDRFVSASTATQGSVPLGTGAIAPGAAPADWNGWKKPQMSQARTRERLVGLLAALGQRIGLLKSPSVIFSPGSETVAGAVGERQMSICSSSGEDLSCVEGIVVTPAEKPAEEGSSSSSVAAASEQQFGLFKEFDFLDECEDAEGDDYGGGDLFNWGARRQMLDADQATGGGVGSAAEALAGSQDLLNMSSSGMRSSVESSSELTASAADLVIGKGPSSAKSSEDEEILSSSPHEECQESALSLSTPASAMTSVSLLSTDWTGLLTHEARGSSSSHSVCSDQDTTEASAVLGRGTYVDDDDESLVRSSMMPPSYAIIPSDEVDEAWRSHVHCLTAGDTSATGPTDNVASTFGLFAKLFKETKRKMVSITKEACFYLSKMHSLRDISSAFLSSMDLLLNHTECSFAYVDMDSANMLPGSIEDHKCAVLSLDEEYESYLQRRELVADCLDSIKSSIKMQSLGNYVSDSCGDEQRLELCHCLYKLHFHLLLLYDNYERLVDMLWSMTTLVIPADGACLTRRVVDLSQDVSALHAGLRNALVVPSSSPVVSPSGSAVISAPVQDDDASTVYLPAADDGLSPSVASGAVEEQEKAAADDPDSAQMALMKYLTEGRLAECIELIRKQCAVLPGHVFCNSAEDDVATLLVFYCRQRSAGSRPSGGVLAVSRPQRNSPALHRKLMEVKRQLMIVSRVLGQSAKVDVASATPADMRSDIASAAENASEK